MIARTPLSLSAGDVVAATPLMAYIWLGLTWRYVPAAPAIAVVSGVLLATCIIGYGALLVVLDDLLSWRRSAELTRWLVRVGLQVAACLLFVGDLAGVWPWISD